MKFRLPAEGEHSNNHTFLGLALAELQKKLLLYSYCELH